MTQDAGNRTVASEGAIQDQAIAKTRRQALAVGTVTLAVAEAIRELGTVPSGELYAMLGAGSVIRLDLYQDIISGLARRGWIVSRAHELTWCAAADPQFHEAERTLASAVRAYKAGQSTGRSTDLGAQP